jgi:hypothetical protein
MGQSIRREAYSQLQGKTIKNKEEILYLLKAIWLLKEVAVLYCRRHQKRNDPAT